MDPVVKTVTDKYLERSEVGFKKYGTNLTRNDLNLDQWLVHLQEELMDATLYIERIRIELKNLESELPDEVMKRIRK